MTCWMQVSILLEKTLESPLDSKIKIVHPKGNQPWIFIGRTDAEAEALILWPPDVKSHLTGKDRDAWKDWRPEEKRITGWDGWMDLQLNGHEFEQALGVGDGQGGLGAAVHGVAKSWTSLSDWVTPVFIILGCHNKIPQTGWLRQQICRLENSRSKWGWFCSWWGLSLFGQQKATLSHDLSLVLC